MRDIANQQKYILQQKKNVVAGKNLPYIALTMVILQFYSKSYRLMVINLTNFRDW